MDQTDEFAASLLIVRQVARLGEVARQDDSRDD
jgi:hypothetical protein